ncbi:MAG: AAA family ATPase [Myxococcales bacterium]|nr:AAA family ATPase [Myxococcales bacterium]
MDSEGIRQLVDEHARFAEADARRFGYQRDAGRQVAARLLDASAERRAVVLDGPRRTGKSVALRQVAVALRAGGLQHVHYCDLGDIRLSGVGVQALVEALVDTSTPSVHPVLLLDEVHYTGDRWAQEIKFVVDNVPVRVAVADSAVAMVQSNLQQDLADRYNPVRIHPLPFAEWRDLRQHLGLPIADEEDGAAMGRECRQFLQLGGFPAHVESRGEARSVHELLRRQVVAQAARDDIGRLRGLRDVDSLERLFVSRIANSGSLLNNLEAAQLANVSAPTARQWLQAMIDTKLLWPLLPFARSAGKHERARAKLYSIDPGLVEACSIPVFGEPTTAVLGRQLETAVAQALRVHAERRSGRLSYLQRAASTRQGAEVDFILEHDGRTHAIECTLTDDARKLGPIKRHLDDSKLSPDTVAVVSLRTQRDVVDIAGTEVHLLPLHELLLAVSDSQLEDWPW